MLVSRSPARPRMPRVGRAAAVLCAAALLVFLMVCDLVTGPSGMPLNKVIAGLAAGPGGADRTVATILWSIRMP